MYAKVLNPAENHHGYQYKVGINKLDRAFYDRDSTVDVYTGANSLYSTLYSNLAQFLSFGDHIRQVEYPADARVVFGRERIRSDQIELLEPKYPLLSKATCDKFELKYIEVLEKIALEYVNQEMIAQFFEEVFDVLSEQDRYYAIVALLSFEDDAQKTLERVIGAYIPKLNVQYLPQLMNRLISNVHRQGQQFLQYLVPFSIEPPTDAHLSVIYLRDASDANLTTIFNIYSNQQFEIEVMNRIIESQGKYNNLYRFLQKRLKDVIAPSLSDDNERKEETEQVWKIKTYINDFLKRGKRPQREVIVALNYVVKKTMNESCKETRIQLFDLLFGFLRQVDGEQLSKKFARTIVSKFDEFMEDARAAEVLIKHKDYVDQIRNRNQSIINALLTIKSRVALSQFIWRNFDCIVPMDTLKIQLIRVPQNFDLRACQKYDFADAPESKYVQHVGWSIENNSMLMLLDSAFLVKRHAHHMLIQDPSFHGDQYVSAIELPLLNKENEKLLFEGEIEIVGEEYVDSKK